MKTKVIRHSYQSSSESGAALVAALFVTILLLTASAFLLSSVGNNSRNTSDVLAETKAYYAAESGIQAGINFFRNDTTVLNGRVYSYAVSDPTLSGKLAYTTVNGHSQVNVGTNSGYSLYITDPDNSAASIGYGTHGTFDQGNGTYLPTMVYHGSTGSDTLTFSFIGQSNVTVPNPITNGQPFGSLQVTKAGTGATMSAPLKFRIDYVMSAPRAATRTIRGTISTTGVVTFEATTYSLMGSTINLCTDSTSVCTAPSPANISSPFPPSDTAAHTLAVYGTMTAIEPYRLKVLSTGYGPNGAMKRLEAVVQRNFLNDIGSSAAISMLGPNAYFNVGSSNQMSINGGSNASITVTDSTGLTNVINSLTGPPNRLGNVTPAPEISGGDLPYWQQSPAAMDAFVNQLKQAAINSGRYFNGTNPSTFGNFNAGTGITFCDMSCSMGGNSEGGGILVVTHTFFTSGNPRFNGLVLVVGQYINSGDPGGVVRSGGGNEVFTGNTVIAPYDPNNLAAGWGQPRYDQNGGAGDTIDSDIVVDQALDGTSAITDFVQGIAEK